MFDLLDMKETYLDYNDPLIAYRSKSNILYWVLHLFIILANFFIYRYYIRNSKKRLINVPYVDNSYKWAGGGYLSTVGDLIKYGNHILASYNNKENTFLNSSTMMSYVWKSQSIPVSKIKKDSIEEKDRETYGLGWHLNVDDKDQLNYVYHTGGAVGATTCILIVPTTSSDKDSADGIVVTVLCNLSECFDIVKLSLKISKVFQDDE